jgi:hypothetical protein
LLNLLSENVSRASGVLYSESTSYDNNTDNCWRLADAYSVQINQNLTWAKGRNELEFVACSGAQYADIAENKATSQLSKAGHPSFITLTVGGNNIGFLNIILNCIYQPTFNNYGNPYEDDPNRTGACARSIDLAMDNFDNWIIWMQGTMADAIANIVPNPTFDLFLTGYVHFFNTDEDSQCNNWSFGAIPPFIPGSNQPKLSYPLRRDLNNLVQQVNNQYSRAVTNVNEAGIPKGSKAHFVDISPFVDGHRFCEEGYSFNDQYYNGDMWIWNLSPNIPLGEVADYPTINSTSSVGFTDQTLEDGLFNDTLGGIRMRPFHPNAAGHAAIQNEILAAMKDAKLTGTIWEG